MEIHPSKLRAGADLQILIKASLSVLAKGGRKQRSQQASKPASHVSNQFWTWQQSATTCNAISSKSAGRLTRESRRQIFERFGEFLYSVWPQHLVVSDVSRQPQSLTQSALTGSEYQITKLANPLRISFDTLPVQRPGHWAELIKNFPVRSWKEIVAQSVLMCWSEKLQTSCCSVRVSQCLASLCAGWSTPGCFSLSAVSTCSCLSPCRPPWLAPPGSTSRWPPPTPPCLRAPGPGCTARWPTRRESASGPGTGSPWGLTPSCRSSRATGWPAATWW